MEVEVAMYIRALVEYYYTNMIKFTDPKDPDGAAVFSSEHEVVGFNGNGLYYILNIKFVERRPSINHYNTTKIDCRRILNCSIHAEKILIEKLLED